MEIRCGPSLPDDIAGCGDEDEHVNRAVRRRLRNWRRLGCGGTVRRRSQSGRSRWGQVGKGAAVDAGLRFRAVANMKRVKVGANVDAVLQEGGVGVLLERGEHRKRGVEQAIDGVGIGR